MKCVVCGNKFKTKGVRRCANAVRNVCDRCAQTKDGYHRCDLRCPHAKMPKINWYPCTSGVIGWGAGKLKTTVDEFLPRAFHFVECRVLTAQLTLVKPSLLRFSTTFMLRGSSTLPEDIYEKEGWKLQPMRDAYKDSNAQYESVTPAPIFVMFVSGGAKVNAETIELRVNGEPTQVVPNDLIDLVAMPDSFPPQRSKSKPLADYSYYEGKATVFYAPFELNKIYNLTFDIECHADAFMPALLYPYRFVDIASVTVANESNFDLSHLIHRGVRPIRQMSYPLKQTHNWNKDALLTPVRPIMNAGDPLRSLPLRGMVSVGHPLEDGKIEFMRFNDYTALHLALRYKPRQNTGVHIETNIASRPLPVRIYQQLQQLPRYRDFLISFELSNFGARPVELEVSSEILGITDPAITTIQLDAYEQAGPDATGKKWWQLVAQCPRMQFGVLDKVAKAQEATLKYEVVQVEGSKRTTLKRGTETVKLLPRDMIVWALDDQRSGMQYDLANLLGAWVSPTDVGGELDRVRGAAKKYHPDGVLVGMQANTTIASQTAQVKALFEYLGTDEGIRYVNHAFAYDYNQGGQRVLPPETVLKTKSGNCIDLTVLMASLLEGLGINALIMLMPGHAFLGWGKPYNTDEMDVLECTMVGGKFDDAQAVARDNFRKHFFFVGWDDKQPTPNDLLMMRDDDKKAQIVSMDSVRGEGINSQTGT